MEIPLGCVVEWEDSGDSFLFNDFALSPDCKKKTTTKKKHNKKIVVMMDSFLHEVLMECPLFPRYHAGDTDL